MFSDELKNNNAQKTEYPEKIRKNYEKPALTCLDALDVGTAGGTNVPENTNGLLS